MSEVESLLDQLKQAIIDGDDAAATEAARQALKANIEPMRILNQALMAGAQVVGERFEDGSYFLPELMLAGRALKAAMVPLTPALKESLAGAPRADDLGKVVLATVQTDIHDIGKNMVGAMLSGVGFEVLDMGVDVPIREIIAKAKEEEADIIACSALLTTSAPFMRDLINLLQDMGLRERYIVMVGGAAVSPEFAAAIGADGTAPNAVDAVKEARRLLRLRRVRSQG
jgi:corrinoid protein of di/trimethylamine methyltransferase